MGEEVFGWVLDSIGKVIQTRFRAMNVFYRENIAYEKWLQLEIIYRLDKELRAHKSEINFKCLVNAEKSYTDSSNSRSDISIILCSTSSEKKLIPEATYHVELKVDWTSKQQVIKAVEADMKKSLSHLKTMNIDDAMTVLVTKLPYSESALSCLKVPNTEFSLLLLTTTSKEPVLPHWP